jgi:integrase
MPGWRRSNQVAATTGDDPELDTLLLRLQTETACRRGGALALRPADLDPDQYLILLREKGETVRWQPVSPTLMARLVRHGQDRHAPDGGQLLRYADGRPITSRRYDHLWARIGRELSWVRTQQISTHWIRHTTLTYQFSEDGIPEILAEQRLGHQIPEMRGLYAHASQQMREKLTAALQARWDESLRQRAAIDPNSPVPLLDNLLAPFRAAPAGHPGPAPR